LTSLEVCPDGSDIEPEADRVQSPVRIARLPLFSRAMWFIWLLRSDIRQGAAPNDPEAQREFIAWWLLRGRTEYPAVWHWDAELADVAMELVPMAADQTCPRLLRRIHRSRDDLRQAFPLRDKEGLAEFLCWYRVYGPLELDAAPQLPEACLAITERPSRREAWSTSGVRVPRMAITLARRVPNLPLPGPNAPRVVADWYETYGRNLAPSPTSPPAPVVPNRHARRLVTGGVNLVGFVRGQSGLGEDVRMAAAALGAVDIPHVLCNAPAPSAMSQRDNSLAHKLTDRLRYDITIYFMSAFDMATLYLARGPDYFAGQYRIGYWPWELPRFPELWSEAYTLVDEIWTGSTFTASAYRSNGGVPVHRLPCPVVLPQVRPVPRHRLGLHDDRAFVFVYPFDVNSYLARKNPLGLVRAFRRAFPPRDRRVALLLRVNGNPDDHAGWLHVARECAADPRITILAGALSRDEALGIVAACDCLVSPHRGEGFGRNIAEAILLGVPVLATAFSGCMDFLAPEEGISFLPTPVQPGDYPFCEGQWWAEPAIEEMADRMRTIRRARQTALPGEEQRLVRRRSEMEAAYSARKAGRDFARRLRQIERRLRSRQPN
jgi:glycosyltransferase involved in cell wall biosynthesis